ncbi:hypothetical protein WE348_23060 (plasmid) [Alteromonas macleodii]|uniref:hypothetical protein n=1 Tax=Alteromonas macleodii TaxID=28108 RepID=UPI0030D0CC8A
MLEVLEDIKFWWDRKVLFTERDQLEFMSMFNSYLEEGDGLKLALDSTKAAYADVYGDDYVVVKICKKLSRAVGSGKGFDQLMGKFFSPAIAVGFELSKRVAGDKSNVLGIIDLVETESRLKGKAISNLALPLVLFAAGLLINVVMGGIVIPRQESISGIVVDTPEALLAKGIAWFFLSYWYLVILLIGFMAFGVAKLQSYMRPDDRAGTVRVIFDNVWPFNLYKIFWSIRLARLLGYLKLADVKDIEALKIIKKFSSRFMGYHIDILISGLQVGREKKHYFGKELFLPTQMIRIRRFFTNADNAAFANALVAMSYKSEKDVEMQNRRTVTKYVIFFVFVGLGLSIFGIGAVIDAALLSID